MPELVEQYPDTYANMGIHDLGDTMFAWLKENNPGARLNEAYSGLPVAEITRVKRTTRLSTTMSNWYPLKICQDVSRQTQLSRIRQESRCCCLVKTSAIKQSASKLFTLAAILGSSFPGFEHETEGTEIIDGIYHVMCVKA